MKYVMMIAMLLGLSGCQTMGTILSGMGKGMANGSRQSSVNCYSTTVGYTTQTTCN